MNITFSLYDEEKAPLYLEVTGILVRRTNGRSDSVQFSSINSFDIKECKFIRFFDRGVLTYNHITKRYVLGSTLYEFCFETVKDIDWKTTGF